MLWFPFGEAIWDLFSFSGFFSDSYSWSNLKVNSICYNLNIVSLASDETNIFTQNHRIWAWLRCDGGGFLNLLSPGRLSYHTSPRTMCSSIFNISMDRDCTASLSNLYQCLTILTIVFSCVYMESPDLFCFVFLSFYLLLSLGYISPH